MPNHKELLSSLSKQEYYLNKIYAAMSSDLSKVLKKYKLNNNSKLWFKNDEVKKAVESVLSKHRQIIYDHISKSASSSWELANVHNDKFVNNYIKGITIPNDKLYFQRNNEALKAFLKRQSNGLNLSDRVWNLSNQTKSQLEYFIAEGLTGGRSAANLAQDLQRYLKQPEKRFRRVRSKATGKLILSDPASKYSPGRGVYRSSYKNALRLARNEINIAYRSADYERRKQLPFVTGITVHLSNAHPKIDICDELIGDYPKDFVFTGWHPNCYDKETEVYTDKGWLKFKDVTIKDKAISLNEHKNLEWANIDFTIKKPYKGEMIHFHNRSLDMVVTPDHPMVYVPKSNTKLIYSNKTAENYDHVKGGLYRSSEYISKDIENIKVGDIDFNFKDYCQFMGYYLSDGNISRKYAVIISQRKDHDTDNYNKINNFLKSLNIKFSAKKEGFNIYNETLWHHLKKFGKCNKKYIPEIIKNSSPKEIKYFLDSFVSCDGYIRNNKSFIGSNGTLCVSKNVSRSFFTTSKRMADDIGELILKIGKRPSFNERKCKGETKEFKNGTYKLNHNLWIITECHSKTATVFKKDIVDYNDYVYDIQLNKNHIILTRRNGKVVWGSNCLCYTTSKLLSKKDFIKQLKGNSIDKSIYTNTIPVRASNFLNINSEKIKSYKSKPSFIADNFKNTKDGFALKNE